MNLSGVVGYLAQLVRPGHHFIQKRQLTFSSSVEAQKFGTHTKLQQQRCCSVKLLRLLARPLPERGC